MNLELIRAVILFAIGDPDFRRRLIDDPEQALAACGLGVDDQLILTTIGFDGPIAFGDEQLLEQLLGSAKTGWESFGGFDVLSGLAPPVELSSFADLLDQPDFVLPSFNDPFQFDPQFYGAADDPGGSASVDVPPSP